MVRKKVKKSRVKKVPGEKRSASAAYNDFVVVLENVYSEINVVGDSLDLFREQANARFDSIEQKLDQLDKRVTVLEVQIRDLAEDTESIGHEIRLIRHDLTQKINREEFKILEERVTKLERELAMR